MRNQCFIMRYRRHDQKAAHLLQLLLILPLYCWMGMTMMMRRLPSCHCFVNPSLPPTITSCLHHHQNGAVKMWPTVSMVLLEQNFLEPRSREEEEKVQEAENFLLTDTPRVIVATKNASFLQKHETMNRRGALFAMMATAGTLLSSPQPANALVVEDALVVQQSETSAAGIVSTSTSRTIVDPLERLQLGQGQWKPKVNNTSSSSKTTATTITASTSSSSLPATIPPPAEFSTYAARFLLHYDAGAAKWWTDLQQTTRLLSDETRRDKLSNAFASFAKTIEMAITESLVLQQEQQRSLSVPTDQQQQLFYQQLWHVFVKRYAHNDKATTNTASLHQSDVMRHIGILFSLLPSQHQPIKCMLETTTRTSTRTMMQTTKTTNVVSKQQHLSYSILDDYFIQNDYTQLLPSNYHAVVEYSYISGNKKGGAAASFRIDPPLIPTVRASMMIPSQKDIKGINNNNNKNIASWTIFGPLAVTPLTRGRPTYEINVYALLGIAGATGCALTHSVVIPLDVIKTRAQTNPPATASAAPAAATVALNNDKTSSNKIISNSTTSSIHPEQSQASSMRKINFLQGAMDIVEKEGIEALTLGAQATVAGYFWYGLSVYPSYTFFKRFFTLSGVMPPELALVKANDISLIAGALAAVVASLGLTPLEAARIRVVAEPEKYRPLGLSGTLGVIATEKINGDIDNNTGGGGGVRALYAGFPSLLARQVIFGSVKFLAFERACDFIFSRWPMLNEATWTALCVSLVAGGFSGALSSVVSQPADSLLTYVAQNAKRNLGLFDGCRIMIQEDGIGSLFRGLGSRCVWAGCIIAGQFLLYDVFRTWFGVTADDLSQVYEVTLSSIT